MGGWVVRGEGEEVPLGGCGTIRVSRGGSPPQGSYHYYTCPQLGPNKAALRRHPCGCDACHKRLGLEWAPGESIGGQPRPKANSGCWYYSLLGGGMGDWYIATLEPLPKGGSEEAHAGAQVGVVGAITATIALAKWGLGALGLWLLRVVGLVATIW